MALSRSTMATVWNVSQSKLTTEEVAWLATESIVWPLSCKSRYDNSQLCSTFHFLCIPYRYTFLLVHTSLQNFHYNFPALHRAPLDEVWCRRHCDLVGTRFFLLASRIHPRIFVWSRCSILIRLRCLVLRKEKECIYELVNSPFVKSRWERNKSGARGGHYFHCILGQNPRVCSKANRGCPKGPPT